MGKTRIGIVGVGAISGIYLENITNTFSELEIIGVCDLIRERAENAVKKYNIPKLYKDMYELFADPDVDIVLNLTRPYEHFDVSMAALKANKNVYSEKPLGASFEEGKKLVAEAKRRKLHIGGAPDTFLGGGIQTCRDLIDSGEIGTPIGAAAFMICHGHESWHPDPEFYYKYGGGPMMDMGPYYITALVNMMGPVESVCAMTRASFPERLITSQPHNGEIIKVDVPTYVAGTLRFASGAIGTIFTTFDVYHTQGARLEVYGSEGTIFCPDPNGFSGPVQLLKPGAAPVDVPERFPYVANSRALGLAEMAKALEVGRDSRTDSELTYHVLEILTSFEKASDTGREIKLKTTFRRQPPIVKPKTVGVIE